MYATPLSAQGFYHQRQGALSKTTSPAWQSKSSAPAGTESNTGAEDGEGVRMQGDRGEDRDERKEEREEERDRKRDRQRDHEVKMETKIGGEKERQR